MDSLHMGGAFRAWNALIYNFVVAERIRPLFERLADELERGPGLRGRVLDVGCGGGQLLEILSRRAPTSELVGVDLSPTMIRIARHHARGRPNLRFLVGDAMALPLAAGTFDLVLSVTSLKHWPDKPRGVAEMVRVARPGGQILVVELDRGLDQAKAEAFVARFPRPVRLLGPLLASYFRRVVAAQGQDLAELRELLTGAGLEQVEGRQDADGPIVYAHGRKPA